jgi:hypothetical protein
MLFRNIENFKKWLPIQVDHTRLNSYLYIQKYEWIIIILAEGGFEPKLEHLGTSKTFRKWKKQEHFKLQS